MKEHLKEAKNKMLDKSVIEVNYPWIVLNVNVLLNNDKLIIKIFPFHILTIKQAYPGPWDEVSSILVLYFLRHAVYFCIFMMVNWHWCRALDACRKNKAQVYYLPRTPHSKPSWFPLRKKRQSKELKVFPL